MSFRASAGFQAHVKMHGRQQTKPAQIVSHNVRHVPTDNGHPPNGPTPGRSTTSPKIPSGLRRSFPARKNRRTCSSDSPGPHPPVPCLQRSEKTGVFILPGTKTNGESRTNRFSPFSMVRSISGPRTNAQRYSFAAFLTYLSSHPKNSRFHSSEFCGLKT